MFKLISVNIERDKHIDRVLSLLNQERPEILFLQEVFERDYAIIKTTLPMDGIFTPLMISEAQNGRMLRNGDALLSRFPLRNAKAEYYYESEENLPTFGTVPLDEHPRALTSAEVEVGGRAYTCATTHFTRSDEGVSTDKQKRDMRALLALLEDKTNLVLAGDFNAPRGRETFAMLAEHYKDNIPEKYKTSLDQNLHRKNGLQLIVDGLFTSDDVRCKNVKLVDGVSDHMAIVAEIR